MTRYRRLNNLLGFLLVVAIMGTAVVVLSPLVWSAAKWEMRTTR